MINNGKDVPDIAWRVWNKYYMEGDNKVVTEYGHAFRAQCCSCGCRHCPYEPKYQGSSKIREDLQGKLGFRLGPID